MTIRRRMEAVEARLTALEERLSASPPPAAEILEPAPPVAPPPPLPAQPASRARARRVDRQPGRRGLDLSAPLVLGWAGAAVLVLAAAYLVRVGITYGWLTPALQVMAAGALGVVMIGTGLVLRLHDRPYASLLAAAGIAVLYLSIFGAHLVHRLLGPMAATGLLVVVAAGSLLLHAILRERLFATFALAGSYATPLLVQGRGGIGELAVYLTVWNLVYGIYALWIDRRGLYLAALYASLIVFEVAWRTGVGTEAWRVAAIFQLAQFVLFAGVALTMTLRRRRGLGPDEALAHFPAMILFYALEYAILVQHAPRLAPWMGLGLALAAYGTRAVARALLATPLDSSRALVHGFGAVVLLHAVYADLVPGGWRPLAALAGAVTLLFVLPRLAPRLQPGFWPYTVAGTVLLAAGWFELLVRWPWGPAVADVVLVFAFPAVVYWIYGRSAGRDRGFRMFLLVPAHTGLLAACALVIQRWSGEPESTIERLWLSLAWAAVGVATLVAARVRGDRLLARSSLALFALFAGKVLVIDLGEAAPLVRVGCLAILGVSLYLGGWIYRRLLAPDAVHR